MYMYKVKRNSLERKKKKRKEENGTKQEKIKSKRNAKESINTV